MVLSNKGRQRLVWWLIFLSALGPFVWLFGLAFTDNLGADPAKTLVIELGTWSINFLWISLAITPLRKLLNWKWLIKYRRMMGLYCFFYTMLHFLGFATFIVGWDATVLLVEITERPYAIVGFIALLLLLPLAITSTKKMQKRLKKHWISLHKLVYLIACLALLHVIWQIRANYSEALIYSLLLITLLGYRFYKSQLLGRFLANRDRS